jgi:Co/Zn/Cd efflux system component
MKTTFQQLQQSYTFGYKRAEILGALLSIVTIWYVTGVLLYLVKHFLRLKLFFLDRDLKQIS